MSTAPDFSQLVLDLWGGELEAYGLVIIDAMCLYMSIYFTFNGYFIWISLVLYDALCTICTYPVPKKTVANVTGIHCVAVSLNPK